jgi:hypothetical protein
VAIVVAHSRAAFATDLADITALVPIEHVTVITPQSARPSCASVREDVRAQLPGARVVIEPEWRGTAPAVVLGLIETVMWSPEAMVLIACESSPPAPGIAPKPDADGQRARALARADVVARRGGRIVILAAPAANGRIIPISAPGSMQARLARVLSPDRQRQDSATTAFRWTGMLVAPARVLFDALATAAPALVRLFLHCAGRPDRATLERSYAPLDAIDLLDLLADVPQLWLVDAES